MSGGSTGAGGQRDGGSGGSFPPIGLGDEQDVVLTWVHVRPEPVSAARVVGGSDDAPFRPD
jgi:hypothetical protein